MLFGLLHHLHDFGVTGIGRQFFGTNGQCRLAVDRARQHLRARGLGHHVRLARQIRFIHHAVTFDHGSVDRTNLVGKDEQLVSDLDIRKSTSSTSELFLRCATEGIRFASARNTEDARRTA